MWQKMLAILFDTQLQKHIKNWEWHICMCLTRYHERNTNAEVLGTFKALPALEFQYNLVSLELPWIGVSLRLTRQGWIFHRIPEDCLLEKFHSFDASGFFLLSSMRKVVNLGNPSQLWNALQLGRSSQLRNASQKGNATQLGNASLEKTWTPLKTLEKTLPVSVFLPYSWIFYYLILQSVI